MEQNSDYVYTLKQSSQFKKDLKAVKFNENKLDELQKVLRLCRVATELDNSQTDYWLDVIHAAGYFTDEEYTSLDADNKELIRLLAAIVKTSKEK